MPAIFFIAIAVFQGLIFLGHWFTYAALVVTFGIMDPATLIFLRALFFVLSLSFISITFISIRYSNRFVRTFYFLSAYWMGFLYFSAICCGTFWIIVNITVARGVCPNLGLFGLIACALAIVSYWYGVFQASNTKAIKLRVKLEHLPAFWKYKKVVFFSDMHLGNVRGARFAKSVVRKINALKPEAVFIGGDLFDGVRGDNDALIAPLRGITAPLGTFFVAGNHDEFRAADKKAFLEAVHRAGMRILNNEKIDLKGLQLLGVDFKDADNKEHFAKLLANMHIQKTHPSILLKHVPVDLDVASEAGVSLNLSGHTHKGQMPPINWITQRVYGGFAYGMKRLHGMHSFTSSGVGTWGPPIRIGSRSEIVEIEFE